MRKVLTSSALLLSFFLIAGKSFSQVRVNVNVGIGTPVYFAPAPAMVVYPTPVVVRPVPHKVVVYNPAPVVYKAKYKDYKYPKGKGNKYYNNKSAYYQCRR